MTRAKNELCSHSPRENYTLLHQEKGESPMTCRQLKRIMIEANCAAERKESGARFSKSGSAWVISRSYPGMRVSSAGLPKASQWHRYLWSIHLVSIRWPDGEISFRTHQFHTSGAVAGAHFFSPRNGSADHVKGCPHGSDTPQLQRKGDCLQPCLRQGPDPEEGLLSVLTGRHVSPSATSIVLLQSRKNRQHRATENATLASSSQFITDDTSYYCGSASQQSVSS